MVDQNELKVAGVLDSNHIIVLNKGEEDGIKNYHQFLIYEIGGEILDPDTGDSLGNIELVKGKGKVKHLQPKMTIVESMDFEYEVETNTSPSFNPVQNYFQEKKEKKIKVRRPFDYPHVGDNVKIINA